MFSVHTRGRIFSAHKYSWGSPFIFILWLDSYLLRFEISFLELIMTGERLSKVSRLKYKDWTIWCFGETDLGANEEVVLLQDFLLGQMTITVNIRFKYQMLGFGFTVVKIRWNNPCLQREKLHVMSTYRHEEWITLYLHFLQVHQAIAICVSELGELLSFTCHPVRLWQRRWENNIRSEQYHVRHQPRPRPCTCPQCIRQCWPAQINFSKILKLRNQESIQSIRPVLTCPSPSLSMSSRVSWTTMSLMCSASSGWRKAENS